MTSSRSPSGSNAKSGFVQLSVAGTRAPATVRQTESGPTGSNTMAKPASSMVRRQLEAPPSKVSLRMRALAIRVDVDVEDVVGARRHRVREVHRRPPALDDDASPSGHGAQTDGSAKPQHGDDSTGRVNTRVRRARATGWVGRRPAVGSNDRRVSIYRKFKNSFPGALRPKSSIVGGIVRLTLRPAQCRDEHSPAPLPAASLSARNHQPCRLALPTDTA